MTKTNRILLLNGSPRMAGDTAALISKLKETLTGEIVQINAYTSRIAPCNDCRYCRIHKGCRIGDDMQAVYQDDFDTVIIASPVYMHSLTPPLLSIASRLQLYYSASRFLKDPFPIRDKKAALILTGGGDGSPECAVTQAKLMFRAFHAQLDEQNIVTSLKTDTLPAAKDENALAACAALAERLSRA